MFDTEFSIRLTEKAYRIAYFDAANVISEGKISILVERVTDDEVEKLKDQLKSTKQALDDLRQKVPEQMTNVTAYLDKVDAEFKDVNPAKIRLVGNKKRLAKIIGSAASAQRKMQTITQSVTRAFEDLKSAIASDESAKKSLKDNAEDVRELSIEEFIKKHGGVGSLDDATFRKGISNAYTPPPKAKGFFAKIVRALGFEALPPSDAKFTEDLMKIPLEKIIAWSSTPAMTRVSSPASAEQIRDSVSAATSDVADLTGQDQGQDQPGEDAEQPDDEAGDDAPDEEAEEAIEDLADEMADEAEAEAVADAAEEAADEDENEGLPTLSSILFQPVDSDDRSKGMKMRDDLTDPQENEIGNRLRIALQNIADTSLKSSYDGLVDKPNTANRRSFISNIQNLKSALDRVKLESKSENGELILEQWQKLAGIKEDE